MHIYKEITKVILMFIVIKNFISFIAYFILIGKPSSLVFSKLEIISTLHFVKCYTETLSKIQHGAGRPTRNIF